MNLQQFLLFLAAGLSLSLQCNKKADSPQVLPPITQEGKNTFGFKVDGAIWTPYYRCGFSSDPCGELICDIANIPPSLNFIAPKSMGAANYRKDQSYIIITCANLFLSQKDYIDSITVVFSGDGNYSLGISQAGDRFVISKIDTSQRIISGTFDFTLKATDGSGRTVRISEGRFDFKYPFCRCSN